MAVLKRPRVRQVNRSGPARYAVVDPPPPADPEVCRFCGGDIMAVDGHWYAVEGRWPNLAHCHYSARNSEGVGHEPDA